MIIYIGIQRAYIISYLFIPLDFVRTGSLLPDFVICTSISLNFLYQKVTFKDADVGKVNILDQHAFKTSYGGRMSTA